MARECPKCGNIVPYKIKVDGRWRNLKGRKNCLKCVPFGHRDKPEVKSKKEQLEYSKGRLKKWYYAKKELLGMSPTKYNRVRNKEAILAIVNSRKCQICGHSGCIGAFDFHHINEGEKVFGLSQGVMGRSWNIIKKELFKCVAICRNCHAEVHAGTIENKLLVALNVQLQGALNIEARNWHELWEIANLDAEVA